MVPIIIGQAVLTEVQEKVVAAHIITRKHRSSIIVNVNLITTRPLLLRPPLVEITRALGETRLPAPQLHVAVVINNWPAAVEGDIQLPV